MRRESTTVVFPSGVLRSSACTGVDSLPGVAGSLRCGCVRSLYGGGPDGHRGLATETTLVVWWSLGVSSLHGGGREGTESFCSDVFLSGMDIFSSRRGRWLRKALAAAAIDVLI
jgi:hypothetical protein